ncbi:MAG: aldehyde dehydrogenase family protein [Anaerolineales bacterium]|jgi:aldehyde dehydrogenase (NAD+)
MTEELYGSLWIAGESTNAASGDTFPVLDPATQQVIGQIQSGEQSDIDRAVEAAQAAFSSQEWRDLEAHERGRLLFRLANKIQEHQDRIARLLSLENGKTLSQAYDEVGTTIRNFEYYAGWADKVLGSVVPISEKVFDYIVHEPLGVVGHITPWNYPLDIFARGVAPCLAVGNTVVAKPAEETPFSTLEIARLATEVGFPDGVINVVTGTGSLAGAALSGHSDIQALAFCGSVATGQEVLHSAARQITPIVSLELGGKSPLLLFDDGDVERAAESAAYGICYNTGQSCGALSRFLVPTRLYDKVMEILRNTLASIRLGRGLDQPDMGPLVSQKQLERVLGYIEAGKQEGASVEYGGGLAQEEELNRGFFVKPTLFGGAKPGMRIIEEEIFGPVIAVLTFDSEEEAVEKANASNYGLSAEIWTHNLSRAHRVARQLDVSHVTINGGGGFGVQAPFGGVKQSGFGREGGWESILQYSRVKNVWINL